MAKEEATPTYSLFLFFAFWYAALSRLESIASLNFVPFPFTVAVPELVFAATR